MDLLLDFIIVGVSIGVVYGLVALGISLIYSGLDIVHFAHGEVYMIGAFVGIAVVNISGMPYFGALVGAMIITASSASSSRECSTAGSRAAAAATPWPVWA